VRTIRTCDPANIRQTFAVIGGFVFAAFVLGHWLRPAETGPGAAPDPDERPEASAGAAVSSLLSSPFHHVVMESPGSWVLESEDLLEETNLEELVALLSIEEVRKRLSELEKSGLQPAELEPVLVRRWATDDPAAAAAWAMGIPSVAWREAAQKQVALGWAQNDFDAAWRWASALPSEGVKFETMRDLAYEAAAADPISALAMANELPAGSSRDDLLIHAVSQWAATDPATALMWSDWVGDSVLRERLKASIAVAAAKSDGTSSAALLASGLEPGAERSRAVVSVVQRWSLTNPGAAAAWVNQFPASELKKAATEALAQSH
jgi:hypothetical protein